MKFIVSTLALIVLLGCSHPNSAVRSAMQQNSAAHARAIKPYFDDLSQTWMTNFVTRQFVNDLHKVDVSGCPRAFQIVWVDYVHTCEREANYNLLTLGWDVARTMHGGFEHVAEHVDKMNANESFRQLESCAVTFGIPAHYHP